MNVESDEVGDKIIADLGNEMQIGEHSMTI